MLKLILVLDEWRHWPIMFGLVAHKNLKLSRLRARIGWIGCEMVYSLFEQVAEQLVTAHDPGWVVEAGNTEVAKAPVKTGRDDKLAIAQPFQVGKDMYRSHRMG